MRNKATILTVLAFLIAAGLSYLMALAVGGALESRSHRHVQRALTNNNLTWVEVSADGLLVTLSGTAPSEAMRYRASIVAGRVVGASRISDEMDVTPTLPMTAPRFSLELLRNDDGISVIGLAPTAWELGPFLAAAKTMADEDLTNMVETADFPVPDTWGQAIDFGLVALQLLPRSKISIAADGVKVDAIADSPDQKHAFETALARSIPSQVPVNVQISAPRAVITPFTLRFVIEDGAPRFDACSADTERARMRIMAAARRAGVPGAPSCVLGLGVPSPRWSEAAEQLIGAMKALGAGSVTISDVDVTLIADHSVAQADFDRVVGELTGKLPDVFSLKATLTPRPQTEGAQGPAQFTAVLSPEGKIELRGRLTDERMRDMVDAFARARFGAQNVYVATRLDEQLPPTWGTRVLAGLGALAEVTHGSVLVEPEAVAVRGMTGNTGASAEISRLLSDRLGQGANYSVEVNYDERLDPNRGLPSPAECLARANTVLSERQITFAPNADDVTGEAARVVSSLAEELEDCAGARLEIGGHTDSQGRAESNLALSQRRAEAVLNGLAARGIDTGMMSAKGYGAAEPIADNATEEGRVANRRIQFKLIADPAAAAGAEDDGAGTAIPTSIRPPARPGAAAAEEGATAVAPTPAETPQTAPAEAAGAPDSAPTTGADDPAEAVPDLAEGEEPMGDAGDLEVGPDGEPILDDEAMTLDDDTGEDTPETASSAADPAAAAEDQAAAEGASLTATPPADQPASDRQPDTETAVAPGTNAPESAPTSPATSPVPEAAPQAEVPDAGTVTPAETAPAPTPDAPVGAAETPAASSAPEDAAAPSPRPAPIEPEAAAPASGTEAVQSATPTAAEESPQAEPAAELPLPPGWAVTPEISELRPQPRPKELAQ